MLEQLLARIRRTFGIRNPRRVYFYSIVIGALAGLGAILFSEALAYASHITYDYILGVPRSHPAGEWHIGGDPQVSYNPWMVLLLPAIGGLLVGIFTKYAAPEAAGSGTDEMIKAFHRKEGRVSSRIPIFKSIATIMTIATGGSAGKEGPSMQIGGGFGSGIARLVGAGARARRTLMLAGMAGGLGAVFRAPFGGALTAVEVVYREDIESDSLVPCILSSVTAYLVARVFGGNSSIFAVPDVAFDHYYELIIYIILGLVCTGAGFVFTKIYNGLRGIFNQVRIHPVAKPAIGGLLVGVVGLFYPEVFGSGVGFLQNMINGVNPIERTEPLALAGFFITIAFLKVITTSLTLSSGGSGGVFAPSLFIGGMLGGATGAVASYIFPWMDISIHSFILVGMAGFFAGVAHAPMAGMIMVCDMIGNYTLLPPLMLVAVITSILSHKWSIYEGQVTNRFKSPAHYWDMNLDILDSVSIKDTFPEYRKTAAVEEHLLLHDLQERSVDMQASDYVVMNSKSEYLGICSLRKIKHTSATEHARLLVTVGDVVDRSVDSVKESQTLSVALRIMMRKEVDKVAITDDQNTVLGYVRYHDIFKIYHEKARRETIE